MGRKNLRVARVKAGISQQQLAARLGTRQAVVSNWETGRATPTPFQEEQIREVFKNTDHHLFDITKNPQTNIRTERTKLKEARFAKGLSERRRLTQADVADEIGCSRGAYSLWECGESDPQEHHLRKLLEYYGATSPQDLDLVPPILTLSEIIGYLSPYESREILAALSQLPTFAGIDLLAFLEQREELHIS